MTPAGPPATRTASRALPAARPPRRPGREVPRELPPEPEARHRILPLVATWILIALLTLALGLAWKLSGALENELASRLRTSAQLVLDALARADSENPSPFDFDLENRIEDIRSATSVSEIALYDRGGTLLGGVARSPVIPRRIRLVAAVEAARAGDPWIRSPERDPSGGLTLVVPVASERDLGAILTRIDRDGLRGLAAASLLFVIAKGLAGVVFAAGLLILLRWVSRGAPEPPARAAPVVASSDVDLVLGTMKEVVTTLKDSESEYRDRWTAAEANAERYRITNDLILESMTSGIVVFDSEGKITMFNRSAERILSVAGRDVVGRGVGEVFGTGDRITAIASNLLAGARTVSRLELERAGPTGEPIWVGVSSSPIRIAGGRPVGGLLLLADITETKRLHRAMGLKDRLAAVGEMSAGIAHEIKNSLHSLMGFGNLLREDFPAGNEPPLAVKGILSEVASLEELVQGVLAFSKPSNLAMRPESLAAILAETRDALLGPAGEAGISIVFRVRGNLPLASVDFQALKRAFMNLGWNALQAMNSQGTLTIEAKVAELAQEEDPLAVQRPWLRVGFRDTGPGIPEADRARIFTPFYTTKSDGNGLGLALVHKTVVDHGGRIELASRVGAGTEFVIHLPAGESGARTGAPSGAGAGPAVAPGEESHG